MPQTKYATTADGVHIAYQVVGDGPRDLVHIPGWVSNVEEAWEEPHSRAFLERLASFSRLFLFDKRGTGLSDPVAIEHLPTLEQRMDDLRAVMDEVGSGQAALFGHSEGGVMSILFAATYPERTSALITLGTFAKRIWSEDYPWAPTPEQREREYEDIEATWGRDIDFEVYAPSTADDPAFRTSMLRYLRRSASPQAALALLKMNTQADIRHVLPVVGVPTLIMNRTGDRDVNVEEGRYLAAHIPGARFVELPGADHVMVVGETEPMLDEIEEFLTGVRRGPEPDRVLATVLFTDIVGSTEKAASIGDRAWSALVERHHAAVRTELGRFRGREIDTAGDGFLATFDGPARAVRCATASAGAVSELGLQIRAGVHTGEVEMAGDDVRGLAVHIGARVAALAGPGSTSALLGDSVPQDAYTASKGAVISLTRNLAVQFGPKAVRANCIHPGFADTPMQTVRTSDPEWVAAMTAEIPLGRLATPRDIANAALFLASDEASYVTGAELIVDGGEVIV